MMPPGQFNKQLLDRLAIIEKQLYYNSNKSWPLRCSLATGEIEKIYIEIKEMQKELHSDS
jgi:hypothetical protein